MLPRATIGRLTEIRMNHKYLLHKIIETLRAVSGSHLNQNLYVFDYVDEITEDMNKVFERNFDQKFMILRVIRIILGIAKKAWFSQQPQAKGEAPKA